MSILATPVRRVGRNLLPTERSEDPMTTDTTETTGAIAATADATWHSGTWAGGGGVGAYADVNGLERTVR
jgi:hypothetical protein